MNGIDTTAADGRPDDYDTLILGIGNLLWADEGFGIRAVEALNARYRLPDRVRVMDGGTQGIFLLPWVRHARRLLIFDAVDFDLEPATLELVEGDDVPRFMGAKKMSMHQAGFQEVLSTAELAGELPAEIALVGIQPERLDDYGGSLRRSIKRRIPAAVDMAVGVLEHWGIFVREREGAAEPVGPGALDMDQYEHGRPVAEESTT